MTIPIRWTRRLTDQVGRNGYVPDPNLQVSVAETAEVALEGELDETTIEHFIDLMAPFVSRGKRIILDLSDLRQMDEAGARCLVSASRATGRPMVLRNPSEEIVRVLDVASDPGRDGAWVIERV
jgi:anti-anti-sigma factor